MPLTQEQAANLQNSVYEKLLGEAYNKIANLHMNLAVAEYRIRELEDECKSVKEGQTTEGSGES